MNEAEFTNTITDAAILYFEENALAAGMDKETAIKFAYKLTPLFVNDALDSIEKIVAAVIAAQEKLVEYAGGTVPTPE